MWYMHAFKKKKKKNLPKTGQSLCLHTELTVNIVYRVTSPFKKITDQVDMRGGGEKGTLF